MAKLDFDKSVILEKTVIVYDGVNNEMEYFYTHDQAEKWIIENFTDEEDGIHPDIESVIILKQTHEIVVTPNDEDELHEISFQTKK